MSSLENEFILKRILKYCSYESVFKIQKINKNIFKIISNFHIFIKQTFTNKELKVCILYRPNWLFSTSFIYQIPKIIEIRNIYCLHIDSIRTTLNLELFSNIHEVHIFRCYYFENIEKLSNVKILMINSEILCKNIQKLNIPQLNTLKIINYCNIFELLTLEHFENLLCIIFENVNCFCQIKKPKCYEIKHSINDDIIILYDKIIDYKIKSICDCHGVIYDQ